MAYCVATREWKGWIDCVASWNETASDLYETRIVFNTDILAAYQTLLDESTEPILAYIHDDVMITEENWDKRVLKEFEDETVGMVGFGGAVGHGSPDLYVSPYSLPNLGRRQFMSNMREAESHGERFTGERTVSVLDGFAVFVRRSILERAGGWNFNAGYFLYTEWLCCEARRQGLRIRLVGVECDHLGGKTSTSVNVPDSYEGTHRWFYENNRDVLPTTVVE